jgi:hypothetical protein
MTDILEPTPVESVLGSGAGGPLSAPTPWIQYTGYLQYSGGIVVGAPTGTNEGAGTINAAGVYANGVQILPTIYLPLAGGTMTGPIALSADPTLNLQAATKQYVDARASGFTIPDAPGDGSTYGRNNAAWTNVIDAGTY